MAKFKADSNLATVSQELSYDTMIIRDTVKLLNSNQKAYLFNADQVSKVLDIVDYKIEYEVSDGIYTLWRKNKVKIETKERKIGSGRKRKILE